MCLIAGTEDTAGTDLTIWNPIELRVVNGPYSIISALHSFGILLDSTVVK